MSEEKRHDTILTETGERVDQLLEPNLIGFARAVFATYPNNWVIDTFDINSAAIEHGLLVPERRAEFCSDDCECAEMILAPDEGFTCYRLHPKLREIELGTEAATWRASQP